MKIRIQDNSIRLRMTLRELEAFESKGVVSRSMQVVNTGGLGPRLEYRLIHDRSAPESTAEIIGYEIAVRLSTQDMQELLRPDVEGVYIRREWVSPQGESHRFMAFVEKDRPASNCVKREEWIYDAPPHGQVLTRPIPSGGSQ